MKIYPAIDLLDGKCVRLKQGDFEQVTVYSEDPCQLLEFFETSQVQNLHVVDLSGARDPSRRQLELVRKLVAASRKLKLQLGGGIRSLREVQVLLELGVERVVLGSIAVTQPETTREILQEFGSEQLTLALDVVEVALGQYRVATQGWKKTETALLEDVLQPYWELGVRRVLCTDISRDGMMQGPNLSLYERLIAGFPGIEVQASGGVSSAQDFPRLSAVGVHSVIVGKAFYEKAISIQEMVPVC